MGLESILVMVGQLNWVQVATGFNHVKKGSKMVVMMDLDQNLFPSTASFGASVSIDSIMSFNVNGIVIIVISGEGGGVFIKELHDGYVGHARNDCNGSTVWIYHELKTSA